MIQFKPYMKNRLALLASLLIVLYLSIYSVNSPALPQDPLATGFVNPPDTIQTSVYWYWLSDNISKEGVINDLYAMKKAGINRAFIGNIGLTTTPYGKVKMFSDEWWDILHAALKKATELNIEIGIFNSPGWSQSGGPWVKAENAMRYLVSSETHVKGPQLFSQKLTKPKDLFQDVKVIAYPEPRNYETFFTSETGTIRATPVIADITNLLDGNNQTGISFPKEKELTIDFESKKPFTARSISIRTTDHPIQASALLQVMKKDGSYQTISSFQINRSNPNLIVGFEPYAPVTASFAATTGTHYRLVIKNAGAGTGLAEVKLSSGAQVASYSEKTFAKMHQTPHPMWEEYQWPLQTETDDATNNIQSSTVTDISKYMAPDGTLTWKVPAGNWIILRTGMTPTGTVNSPAPPEATGYEVDKMSRKHVEKHFDNYLGEILKRIPAADRKCFKVVVEDSYETGGQNFTDDFIAAFKQKYGYDPVPYFPVYRGMVVNSEMASDRFLWDMRRMVADKVAYDYVGGLRDVSHKNGLTTWLENYGHWGFPSEFLMYGGQSDEIGGEFWSEGDLGNIECRAASSCGHIYGKNKISAESNTCAGKPFSRYPATIKQRGDRFFAEGINNTLLHVYISQPYEEKNPGMNAWFGNEFNRKNTWFSQMDLYTQYLKRTNFMLQQGLNVADVAYFIGEDAPKMTGITDPDLPIGYQFDYMNAEVIEKYMTVKDGLITLPHGTQYRILVLPKLETMRPELLAKIKQLVMDGAIVVGPAPQRSPSLQHQPEADRNVKAMAAALWAGIDGKKVKTHKLGKGMVIDGMNMKEALDYIKCVPDCVLPMDSTILFGHRRITDGDIYFITNQTNTTKTVTPAFRVSGKQPELWEASTGYMRDLPEYKQSAGTTAVPLQLAPYESVFIVFRKHTNASSANGTGTNYPQPALLTQLNSPWMVSFDPQQRGPAEPVVFETLQDWTQSKDDRIKYYSGTATYRSAFNLPASAEGKKIIIQLGQVTAMAKVSVNGKYIGGVWTAPYQLDLTKYVKQGKNELAIEVVNTWVNRLIGDSKLPPDQRKTWCPENPYTKDSPLQASGLTGPVLIQQLNSK